MYVTRRENSFLTPHFSRVRSAMRARTWLILACVPFAVALFCTCFCFAFRWLVAIPMGFGALFCGMRFSWIFAVDDFFAPLTAGHGPLMRLLEACT